jgi:hypothetical protein
MQKTPKLALLVPTRERLNLKLTLISSIITTVKDINNVTLYLGVDKDDPTRDTTYKIAAAIPFVKVIDVEPMGKQTNIHKIWNQLANVADEEIIAMVGDDMIFKTKDWDEKILTEFNSQNLPPDKIKLVYCWDGQRNGDLAVNAFVHREYMKYTGGRFLAEEFLLNWADQWLHQVFTAVGRIKYLDDVEIFHNHWVFKGREIDNTAKRMMERDGDKSQTDAMWKPTEAKRVAEVLAITKVTGTTPNWYQAGFTAASTANLQT